MNSAVSFLVLSLPLNCFILRLDAVSHQAPSWWRWRGGELASMSSSIISAVRSVPAPPGRSAAGAIHPGVDLPLRLIVRGDYFDTLFSFLLPFFPFFPVSKGRGRRPQTKAGTGSRQRQQRNRGFSERGANKKASHATHLSMLALTNAVLHCDIQSHNGQKPSSICYC